MSQVNFTDKVQNLPYNSDPHFVNAQDINEIKGATNSKQDAETGKGLSHNDYTDAEKTKLAAIAPGANVYTNADTDARISLQRGAANGIAPLDGSSKVPAAYLPAYVDDVLEFANLAALPVTGTAGIIYITLDTNLAYRWTGSAYQKISDGAVSSVAGKTGVVTLVKADVGLGSVDNTPDSSKPVSTLQATAIAAKKDIKIGTKAGHGFTMGMAVYKDASGIYQRSKASNNTITSTVDGVITAVIDANNFVVGTSGDTFSTSGLGLAAGTKYYLIPSGSGTNYTPTEPSTAGQISQVLFQTNLATEATIVISEPFEVGVGVGGGGSSDIVLIDSQVFTNQNAVDIALPSLGTYPGGFLVKLSKLSFNNASSLMYLRTSADGTTFDTGATDYYFRFDTAGSSPVDGNGADKITLGDNLDSPTTRKGYMTVEIQDADDAGSSTSFAWRSAMQAPFSFTNIYHGGGFRSANAQVQKIKFFLDGTNTFSGRYKIYGLK